MKALVFDMDGTIADFYGVKNWLISLDNKSTQPYEIAKPLYDMDTLYIILNNLRALGWKIIICSWASKNADEDFKNAIAKAKKRWLNQYNFPYDEFIVTDYGVKKADYTKQFGGYQILIDDNASVRADWNLGATIDAYKENVVTELLKLVESEVKK